MKGNTSNHKLLTEIRYEFKNRTAKFPFLPIIYHILGWTQALLWYYVRAIYQKFKSSPLSQKIFEACKTIIVQAFEQIGI